MFGLSGDAGYVARCEALHPSTTPQEVRCAGGANQRTLGHPSACTPYAVAFVRRVAAGAVRSADVTPAWVAHLLRAPGVALPDTHVHPDPCAVAAAPGTGLCVLRGDCAAPARDAVFVPVPELETRLGAWLRDTARVAGALLVTGTETFGVARTADGCVALFDSHGDATQTQPAVAYVWCNNLLGTGRPTIDDGVRGVVDFVLARAGTELELIGNSLDVCVLGFSP